MNGIAVLALLSVTATCLSQQTAPESECEHPAPTAVRRSTPAPRPGVLVQCGDMVNQAAAAPLSSLPVASTSAMAQPARESVDRSPVPVALIAGAAGVLGALAGALASLFVGWMNARSQLRIETTRLRANLIAQERLRWLQDIRQRLSTLYRTMDMQYNTLKRPVAAGEKDQVQEKLDTMASDVLDQSNVIHFMLNPEKDDQAELRNSNQAALHFLVDCHSKATAAAQVFDDSRYESLKRTAFDAMTRIGIRTWKQIKELQ